MNAFAASDPEGNTHLLKHCERLAKYSEKLKFALPLWLDRTGSCMTASETHSSACVDKSGFEDGWMEDSMVANKLGLLM